MTESVEKLRALLGYHDASRSPGAYASRLLFGVFYGPEGPSSHDVHAPGTLFNAPLVPLAFGAIGLGWIEAGTHALSSLLAPAVAAPAHEVHALPYPFGGSWIGWAAFGAGFVGIGLGYAIARTKTKALPLPPLGFVHALLGEVRALPEGVAAVHAGRVGRYALIGLLGTAIFVLLAQRPASGGAPATSAPASSIAPAAPSGPRSTRQPAGAAERRPAPPRLQPHAIPGRPIGPALSDDPQERKRRAAAERMKQMLSNEPQPRMRRIEGAQP